MIGGGEIIQDNILFGTSLKIHPLSVSAVFPEQGKVKSFMKRAPITRQIIKGRIATYFT